MRRRKDGDETWFRLLQWTNGQKSAERLAMHLLRASGYTSIDPSHPLGGRDGTKDALAIHDGKTWVVAVYFPRGQKDIEEIKKKFKEDLQGVKKNQAYGMAFVTNQELRLGERRELKEINSNIPVDLFHLERIANLLDSPQLYGIRLDFLDIEMTKEEQIGFFAWIQSENIKGIQAVITQNHDYAVFLAKLLTGGDSFCYITISMIDPVTDIGHFIIHSEGDFPLYNIIIRITDLDEFEEATKETPPSTEKIEASEKIIQIAEIPPKHHLVAEKVHLKDVTKKRYNIFFTCRNGSFRQLLRIVRKARRLIYATRVTRGKEIIFEQISQDYPRNDSNEIEW